MSLKSSAPTAKPPAEKLVRDIRRATPKHHSAKDKIRIVLEGLRGPRPGTTPRSALPWGGLTRSAQARRRSRFFLGRQSLLLSCVDVAGFQAAGGVGWRGCRHESVRSGSGGLSRSAKSARAAAGGCGLLRAELQYLVRMRGSCVSWPLPLRTPNGPRKYGCRRRSRVSVASRRRLQVARGGPAPRIDWVRAGVVQDQDPRGSSGVTRATTDAIAASGVFIPSTAASASSLKMSPARDASSKAGRGTRATRRTRRSSSA